MAKAGDRFKELTKAIDDLRAKMQGLKVSVDSYKKEGKSLNEINSLISKNLQSLSQEYLKLTNQSSSFVAAQERNIAKNKKQGKSYESLRVQINSISAANDRLRATDESIASVLNSALNPALATQEKINKSVAASIEEENKAYGEKVNEIKGLIKAIVEYQKVDLKAANKKEDADKRAEASAIKLREAQRKAQESSKGFFETLFGSFSSQKIASSIGTVLRFVGIYQTLSGVVNAVKTAFIESTKRFIDFDRALANLAAVGGDEARNSLEQLKQQAIEVAGTTRFTAKEIIGLQTELIKLGFTAKETINLVKPVSETAQALGEDVSSVATVFGQTINAFGLLAEEATYVGDVLVSAINNSALSFNTFATAIQYIGPIAQNAGLTFQQTAQAMGILSDAGFRASRIGTGLRGILSDLGDTSEGIISTIEDLAKSNLTLSDAVDLVGKRNAAQLIVLAKNIDKLKEAGDEYYRAGAATEASKIQIDSFSGAVSILSSSWDSFLTRIGEFIADSPVLLNILKSIVGFLDEDAGAALSATDAFKALSDAEKLFARAGILGVDFEGFFKMIVKQAENGEAAYNRLRKTTEDYFRSAISAAKDNLQLQNELKNKRLEALKELDAGRSAIIAMGDAEKKAYSDSLSIQVGRKKATDEFGKSVNNLIELQKQGSAVSLDEVDILASSITSRIDELDKAIESYGDTNSDATLIAEAQIQALQEYLFTLGRVVSTEKDREAERKKNAEEANKEEYDRIQRQIKGRQESLKALEEQLVIEREYAKQTNDYRAVQELEVKVLKAREQAYSDLSYNIERSTILTKEQKLALLDSISSIKVAESDILNAATRIANSFKAAFDGVEIEDPELLTDIQRSFIDEQINNFVNEFGDSISNEDKARLAEILANSIFEKAGEASKKKADKFKEELRKSLKELLGQAVSAAADSIDDFNDVNYENLKRQFDAEKALIKDRSEFEQNIVKAQLDSQVISQEEYAARLEQIKKKEIQRQNEVEKNEFEADKKRDLQQAQTDLLESIAKAFINEIGAGREFPLNLAFAALTSGIATARYSAQVSAINKRIFVPKRFAQGGIVEGPSHSQGGVPFTINGQGGYEMEGGEYIVNKKSASKYKSLLDQINETKYNPKYKFATGGVVSPQESSNRSLELLEAIAEATTGTAINTGKPVKAFVSSDDLRNDNNARRIKERNSNI